MKPTGGNSFAVFVVVSSLHLIYWGMQCTAVIFAHVQKKHVAYSIVVKFGCLNNDHYCKKKFKKISKRNLPNVGMGGWMEALADKVHKQGSTFHDLQSIR